MKYLFYLILLILIISFNFGVLAPLGLGWLTPSILLLIVVCLSMHPDRLDFFWFGVAGGLWSDIYFGLPIGSFAGAYLLVGLAAFLLFKRLLAEPNWKYYLVCVVVAELFLLTWVWGYTNILANLHWSAVVVSGRQVWHYLPLWLVSAVVSAFPLYALVNGVVRWSKRLIRQPLRL